MDAATFAMAYALSTSVGIRPFLTLALASLAMHLGYIHVSHAMAYLGSDGATWILGGLAVLEFAADKIPVVDHALHAVGFALKPLCALLLVGTTVPDAGFGNPTNPMELASDAMVGVGAVNALGVHGGIAALRGASSGFTLGVANPFVSVVEDVLAVIGTALAIFVPFVAGAFALLVAIVLFVVARALYNELRAKRTAAVSAA